jgi:hypothetical protein
MCAVPSVKRLYKSDQVHNPGNDRDPVQLAKRTADNVSSKMRCGQDRERRGSNHECEKDQPTHPDNQREQHEEAKEGHILEYITDP